MNILSWLSISFFAGLCRNIEMKYFNECLSQNSIQLLQKFLSSTFRQALFFLPGSHDGAVVVILLTLGHGHPDHEPYYYERGDSFRLKLHELIEGGDKFVSNLFHIPVMTFQAAPLFSASTTFLQIIN